MTSRASGAAEAPCSPCSSKTTTTISGLRRGARPTNQAFSTSVRVGRPPTRRRGSKTTSRAAPVTPRQARRRAGAVLVHHAPEGVGEEGDALRLERDAADLRRGLRLQQQPRAGGGGA